jgi:hypothetical protein
LPGNAIVFPLTGDLRIEPIDNALQLLGTIQWALFAFRHIASVDFGRRYLILSRAVANRMRATWRCGRGPTVEVSQEWPPRNRRRSLTRRRARARAATKINR